MSSTPRLPVASDFPPGTEFVIYEWDSPLANVPGQGWVSWWGGVPKPYNPVGRLKPDNNWNADSFEAWIGVIAATMKPAATKRPAAAVTAVTALRAVQTADLPTLFEHQLDPESVRLAAFPSRQREAFMTHWAGVLANPANTACTIVHDGAIAGHIGAWTDPGTGERQVGYWIGRSYWGRGIAGAALARFLVCEPARPLTARVVRHNLASLRVLQKCGFVMAGEDRFTGRDGQPVEELVLRLGL